MMCMSWHRGEPAREPHRAGWRCARATSWWPVGGMAPYRFGGERSRYANVESRSLLNRDGQARGLSAEGGRLARWRHGRGRGRVEKREVVEQGGPEGGAIVEKQGVVDQKADRAMGVMAARPGVFARQGAVVASWRAYRGRRLGPYWRLAYREGGRQRSVYLGRSGSGVKRVRGALARLQRPLRSRRAVRRLRRRVKASMRKCLTALDRQLDRLGLWRKGFEVRGGWSRGLERHFIALGRRTVSGVATPRALGRRRHSSGHSPDSATHGGAAQDGGVLGRRTRSAVWGAAVQRAGFGRGGV